MGLTQAISYVGGQKLNRIELEISAGWLENINAGLPARTRRWLKRERPVWRGAVFAK
jgi:hypothetical protein